MTKLVAWLARSRKYVVAVVTANITWAGIVIDSTSRSITAKEWLAFAAMNAAALGVYGIGNDQKLTDLEPIVGELMTSSSSSSSPPAAASPLLTLEDQGIDPTLGHGGGQPPANANATQNP